MILGLALRLMNLGTEPYWGDEALSADIIQHFSSISEIVVYISEVEFHPPLYYLMLHYWTAWFGITEFAVRSLSVVFGLGCIVLTFIFSRKLFQNTRGALIAALIVAILPFQIEFSQEGRPYSIVCFFGILAALSAWEYVERKTPRYLACYIFVSLAGLYTHYSFFLVQVAIAAWWAAQVISRKDFKEFTIWFAVHGSLVIGYWPWLDSLFYKILLGQYEIFGLKRILFVNRMPDFFERVFEKLIWLGKDKEINPLTILVKTGFKVTFLAMGFFALRRAAISTRTSLRGFRYVVWLIIAPLMLFLLAPFSKEYAPIYERHVIFVTIALCLLFGFIATQLRARQAAVLILIFIGSLIPFVSEITANDALVDPYFKMKEISEHINQYYQRGDIVLVSDAFFRSDAAHYLREEIPVLSLLPINYYDLDIWNTRQTLGIVENEYQSRFTRSDYESGAGQKLSRLVKIHRANRVWLFGFIKKEDYAVYNWFEDNGWRQGFKSIADIFQLDLYIKKKLNNAF